MSRKEKSSKLVLDFPPMVSAPVVITSWSEPLSTADGDRTLTSSFSVSTLTTDTNVSTPTVPTTSQLATENRLMDKSVVCLGDTLTRFIEGQKRPSSGTASRQRNRSRGWHRDHYSYYKRSRSRSPQRFSKNTRHYYGYQHGSRSSSPDLSLNASQSEIDDEHEERFQ